MIAPADALEWSSSRSWRRLALGVLTAGAGEAPAAQTRPAPQDPERERGSPRPPPTRCARSEAGLADAARAAVLVARTLLLAGDAGWDDLDARLPGRLARLGQAVAACRRASPWATFERLEPVLGPDLLCEVLRQRFPRPPPGFARVGRPVGVRTGRR